MDNFNAKELQRRYGGTYVSIFRKDTKEIVGAYVDRIHADENLTAIPSAVLYVLPKEKSEEYVIKGSKGDMGKAVLPLSHFTILPMPPARVFDVNGVTIVFRRDPARQWQRGLTGQNGTFHNPLYTFLTSVKNFKVKREQFRLSLQEINNLLIGESAGSFNKALNDIEDYKLLSRTINDKYFISLYPDKQHEYLLFRMEEPLAYYSRVTDTFTVVNPLFEQEVSDFIRRNNLRSFVKRAN